MPFRGEKKSGPELTSEQRNIYILYFIDQKPCEYSPALRQTAGSVVSSKPEQIAFKTAPFSSFPERNSLRIGKTPYHHLTHKAKRTNLDTVDY